MRAPALSLLALSLSVPACGGPSAVDALGGCYEIFPELHPPAHEGSDMGLYHSNPLMMHLGSISIGDTARASVQYYNYCHEPDMNVLAVELTAPDGGAADPSFAAIAPAGNVVQPLGRLTIRFEAMTAGEHRARVRMRMMHGYYETQVTAVVP